MSNQVHIRDTDKTDCEVCNYKGPCKSYGSMILCPTCLSKELEAIKVLEATAPARVQEVNAQTLIARSLYIDSSIQITQDIFNAKIVAINELKITIDADPTIENKHFTLAQTLESRFKHLVEVIKGLNDKQKEVQSEQRAIQTYYNELAKKLRDDERELIKLRDVQYQPPIKPIGKPKSPTVKKYDKVAIKQAAELSGLPEQAIQMICIARSVTPIEAVRIMKGAISENTTN